MKITGQRIRELRKEHKMTQEELAKMLGTNGSILGKYERGEINVKVDTIKDIATIFDVSPIYLIGLTNSRVVTDYKPNDTVKETIELLTMLSLRNQEIVLNIVKAMLESEEKNGI